MRHNRHQNANDASGFTLLETLVALGIVAILLATLIPISRNTLFRIGKMQDEADRLNRLETTLANPSTLGRGQTRWDNKTTLQVSTMTLPPFDYEKTVKPQWQPVLFVIDVQTATGGENKIEIIRLERVTP